MHDRDDLNSLEKDRSAKYIASYNRLKSWVEGKFNRKFSDLEFSKYMEYLNFDLNDSEDFATLVYLYKTYILSSSLGFSTMGEEILIFIPEALKNISQSQKNFVLEVIDIKNHHMNAYGKDEDLYAHRIPLIFDGSNFYLGHYRFY